VIRRIESAARTISTGQFATDFLWEKLSCAQFLSLSFSSWASTRAASYSLGVPSSGRLRFPVVYAANSRKVLGSAACRRNPPPDARECLAPRDLLPSLGPRCALLLED